MSEHYYRMYDGLGALDAQASRPSQIALEMKRDTAYTTVTNIGVETKDT